MTIKKFVTGIGLSIICFLCLGSIGIVFAGEAQAEQTGIYLILTIAALISIGIGFGIVQNPKAFMETISDS
jgi:hypothetical protein